MINVGLIGAGRIAHVHARALGQHPHARIEIISDPNVAQGQALADQYGSRFTPSTNDIFQDPAVDAVVICSPTNLHPTHIRQAAAAGKPALCEKPVGSDVAEVKKLLDDLAGADPAIMIGFNRRFDPTFAKIHRLVRDGAIGKVEQVTITSRDPAPPPLEYIKVSGGIFKDMTIHDFDMARFFLGDITEVFARGQNLDPRLADSGDYDGAVITLTNAAGAVATIINSRHCASGYDQRLEVFGPDGMLAADNLRDTALRHSTANATNCEEPYLDFFLTRYERAYEAEIHAFCEVVKGGAPSPSLEDGYQALLIAEAAERSARTGTIVELEKP